MKKNFLTNKIVQENFGNYLIGHELLEKRSHPETNVKETFNDVFNKALSKANNIQNIFVSFRDSLHVSDINPYNDYSTPTGFYCYPLMSYEVNKNMSIYDFRQAFPFASERRYITFFVVNDNQNVINNDTTFGETVKYVNRIKEKYSKHDPNISKLCDTYLNAQYNPKGFNVKHDAEKLWLLITDISFHLSDGVSFNEPTIFTNICNNVGITGFIDYKGDGYIFKTEPSQAVFFKLKSIGEIFTFDTKSSGSYAKYVYDGKTNNFVDPKYDLDNIFSYVSRIYDTQNYIVGHEVEEDITAYNIVGANHYLLLDEWCSFISPLGRRFDNGEALVRIKFKDESLNIFNTNTNKFLFQNNVDIIQTYPVDIDDKPSIISTEKDNLIQLYKLNGQVIPLNSIYDIKYADNTPFIKVDTGDYYALVSIINGDILFNDASDIKISNNKAIICNADGKYNVIVQDTNHPDKFNLLFKDWFKYKLVWDNYMDNTIQFLDANNNVVAKYDVVNNKKLDKNATIFSI